MTAAWFVARSALHCTVFVCLCVLHIEPFSLPIDIQHEHTPCPYSTPLVRRAHPLSLQHTPCPYWFSIFILLARDTKLCGHQTTAQRYYIVSYDAVKRVGNAEPCHRTGYDRQDTHASNADTSKERKNERLRVNKQNNTKKWKVYYLVRQKIKKCRTTAVLGRGNNYPEKFTNSIINNSMGTPERERKNTPSPTQDWCTTRRV